jgi:hypothetical protein
MSACWCVRFEHTLEIGQVDVDVAHLDAMLLGIAYNLARSIEPHPLAVEQGTGKGIQKVGIQPAAC